MSLTDYYYRQRPSRLDTATRRIKDWWRPPIKKTIGPQETEKMALLAEIKSDLMLPPPRA